MTGAVANFGNDRRGASRTDLSMFLSDIVAAGGGTSGGTSSSLKSLASLATTTLAASDNAGAQCAATSMSLSPGAVPEPSFAALGLLAGGALLTVRACRGRRA